MKTNLVFTYCALVWGVFGLLSCAYSQSSRLGSYVGAKATKGKRFSLVASYRSAQNRGPSDRIFQMLEPVPTLKVGHYESEYTNLWGNGWHLAVEMESQPKFNNLSYGASIGWSQVEMRYRFQQFHHYSGGVDLGHSLEVRDRVTALSPRFFVAFWNRRMQGRLGSEFNLLLQGATQLEKAWENPDGSRGREIYTAKALPEDQPLMYDDQRNYLRVKGDQTNYGFSKLQANIFLEGRFFPLEKDVGPFLSLAYALPLTKFKDSTNPYWSPLPTQLARASEEIEADSRLHSWAIGGGWTF